MSTKLLFGLFIVVAALALALWGAHKVYATRVYATSGAETTNSDTLVPSAAVKRGDVAFTVSAKGELQGGNSEMLSAPMAGGGALSITFLRESGELVKQGDVVVKFDTT